MTALNIHLSRNTLCVVSSSQPCLPLAYIIYLCSLLPSRLTALLSHATLNEWLQKLYITPFGRNIHQSGVPTALFSCYMAGATYVNLLLSAQKFEWRRKFSRRSCPESNPRPSDHESGALTTELSPTPDGRYRNPLLLLLLIINQAFYPSLQ